MRKLNEVLDYLKRLGYKHHQLVAFINNTDGVEMIGFEFYITSGENLALPHEDYMKLAANVPMTITQ